MARMPAARKTTSGGQINRTRNFSIGRSARAYGRRLAKGRNRAKSRHSLIRSSIAHLDASEDPYDNGRTRKLTKVLQDSIEPEAALRTHCSGTPALRRP
jgi:hypothetical protein